MDRLVTKDIFDKFLLFSDKLPFLTIIHPFVRGIIATMDIDGFEEKLERLVRKNWDAHRLDGYEVWRVLRALGEEFAYNLMQMREVLIDYYKGEHNGLFQYVWQQKMDHLDNEMMALGICLRETVLTYFLEMRVLQDAEIWEVLRRLENKWMIGQLNDKTRQVESSKQEQIQEQEETETVKASEFYSQDEILEIIREFERTV